MAAPAGTRTRVQVDVIIPVRNAAATIESAVGSAMRQEIPAHLRDGLRCLEISLAVCCYDDGSTDGSWRTLRRLSEEYSSVGGPALGNEHGIASRLLIRQGPCGAGRGAGYARNRAIELNRPTVDDGGISCHHRFLCLLDSDDVMHAHRVAEQAHFMVFELSPDQRRRCLLGCKFERGAAAFDSNCRPKLQ